MGGGAAFFMADQFGNGTIGSQSTGDLTEGHYSKTLPIAEVGLGYNIMEMYNVSVFYRHVFGTNYRNGDGSESVDGIASADQVGVSFAYNI